MNRKKISVAIIALLLVGVVGIGGSLAWFTDNETATNTLKLGKVDITLTEDGGEDGTKTEDGISYEGLVPGDKVTKKVTVHNIGDKAYVRVKVTIAGLDETHAKSLIFYDNENKVITINDYIKNEDGSYSFYITRANPMEANDKSGEYVAFKEVEIPFLSWGNEMINKTFTIKVQAQAIQADNNDDGFDIEGLTDDQIVSVDPYE